MYKKKYFLSNFTLSMSVLLILGIIMVIALSVIVHGDLRVKEEENVQTYLSLVSNNFNTLINDASTQLSLVEYNNDLSEFEKQISKENASPSMYAKLNSAWTELSQTMSRKEFVSNVFFYIRGMSAIYSLTKNYPDISNTNEQLLDKYLKKAISKPLWIEKRELLSNTDNSDKDVISIFRRYPYLSGVNVRGLIIVDIKASCFHDVISLIPHYEQGYFYILDDEKNVVYCSESCDPDTGKEFADIGNRKSAVRSVNGESYFITCYDTNNSPMQLTYVFALPYSLMIARLSYITRYSVLFLFIAIVAALILASIYARNSYRPIKAMTDAIVSYELSGQVEYKPPRGFGSDNEFDYVIDKFMQTVLRESEAESKLVNEQLLLKESKLHMLQSQINPHFLYNVLEMINWEAVSNMGQNNSVSMMLRSLSEFFRYITDTRTNEVRLETELYYLQKYLDICTMLYSDRISFEVNIEPGIGQYAVLRLLIQPFVENAIMHGLKNITEDGKVQISVCQQDDRLIITISDNGSGMSDEQITHLLSEDEVQTNKHISAINNILKRIKLHYGPEYGLTINSEIGEGTIIIVTLPQKKLANDNE